MASNSVAHGRVDAVGGAASGQLPGGVHTTRGRLLDGASFRGAGHAPSRVTKALERLLDIVSASSLLAAIGVIALIALLRLRRDLAAAAVALILGSNLTSQVLKHWVFSRPDLGIYETTPATLNSMPSGHSTVAFSVAVALVLVLPPAVRPLAAAGGVVYASLSDSRRSQLGGTGRATHSRRFSSWLPGPVPQRHS